MATTGAPQMFPGASPVLPWFRGKVVISIATEGGRP
jgi:hypothetical protein